MNRLTPRGNTRLVKDNKTHTYTNYVKRGQRQVAFAITKEKKVEIMDKLKKELETSTGVIGFNYQGMSVPKMEELRKEIPEDASLVIAKNTLMKRAAEEVDGWSDVGQFCKGTNAFLFIREDIKGCFKPLRSLQAEYSAETKGKIELEINGGCCDGQYLTLADIEKLEKLPSKVELIAKIASCIHQIPTRLAVGVNQVPTKLAIGIKKVSEGEVEPAQQAA